MSETKTSLISCANLQPGEHISPLEEDLKTFLADSEVNSLSVCAASELQKISRPEISFYKIKEDQTAYDKLTECSANTTASSVLARTSSLNIKKPDAEKAHVEEYQFSFSLNAESLQLLYNQGFFFQPVLGPNPLSNPQKICKISEEGGEDSGKIWVSDELGEHMLDSIDPKNRAVDLPKSYPGFTELSAQNKKIKEEIERVALAIPDGQKERQAFWSHYHSLQDLHSKDATLLRELLGSTQNQFQSHPWLEPVGDLGPDNRRDYVISTTALHYYGAYLIQELRRIGDGVYGEVGNNKTAHALASRLEVMLAEQSDPKSRKVARPISLDLDLMEPALIEYFGDENILERIKALPPTSTNNNRLDTNSGEKHLVVSDRVPDGMSDFDRTSYKGMNGYLFLNEMKLLYALEVFKPDVKSVPAYTWSDLFGFSPKSNQEEYHFVCEVKASEDEPGLCYRRRHSAFEVENEFIGHLQEMSEHHAMIIRMSEIIAMNQEAAESILAHSSANSTKHGFWGGALPFVGLGAAVSFVTYFITRRRGVDAKQLQAMIDKGVQEALKGREVAVGERPQLPENDKSDDDSGVGGEGDSSGEDPVVVPENSKGNAAEYSTQSGRFRFDLMPQLTAQDAHRWGLYAFAAGGGYAAWKLSKTGAKKLGFAAAAAVGAIEFIEAGFDPSKLDPLGSSPVMASEAKALNTQAQDGDWLVDEQLCVKEYHQQESGHVSKFNTGICGLDEIEAYATERGDAAGVQFARSAQAELDAFVEEIAGSIEIERAE